MSSLQLRSSHRLRIEILIEQLIQRLDAFDGDADLEEPGDLEPEETDQNQDEGDFDGGEDDLPGPIWGGQGL